MADLESFVAASILATGHRGIPCYHASGDFRRGVKKSTAIMDGDTSVGVSVRQLRGTTPAAAVYSDWWRQIELHFGCSKDITPVGEWDASVLSPYMYLETEDGCCYFRFFKMQGRRDQFDFPELTLEVGPLPRVNDTSADTLKGIYGAVELGGLP